MKTTKPKNEEAGSIPCFDCDAGILRPEFRDYTTRLKDGKEIAVPDVPFLVCDQCGSEVIGDEGNTRIESFLDHALNSISPEEVQQFLSKYNLTQREASQITGYGEKNISRWASGRARPSESVSNILRLLLADSEAFERLRQKNFSPTAKVSYPAEIRQPDKEERATLKLVDYPKLLGLGLVKKTQSPREKRTEICQLTQSSDLRNFEKNMEERFLTLAAFKDTDQQFSPISAGLWSYIGESQAAKIKTAPYDRDKLRAAIADLRELTQHPLENIADQVRTILAEAGVALVFVPIMKNAALRGCTRLLTPSKALIIHGLKYRSLSQFWLILFHEIAHLLLHIKSPDDVFTDYEEQSSDKRETEADEWTYDTLASLDRELEFIANHPKPTHWQLKSYAQEIKIHPAIAAEIINKRFGKDLLAYSYLKQKGLFPQLSEEQVAKLTLI